MATAQFLERVQVTPTDWSFRFTVPDGYTYKAGQYAVIRMPMRYPDDRFGARTCSFSSSPTEKFLQFTFTVRETGFKKTLMEMVAGEEVMITPARGNLTLENVKTSELVMIAGGIGVAPFRGMVKYMHDMDLDLPKVSLLYSDKDHHEIAFASEWEMYPDLALLITLTRLPENHEWSGLKGRINWEMVKSLFADKTDSTFMLCGSPEMVKYSHELLQKNGVPPQNIIQELFTGY